MGIEVPDLQLHYILRTYKKKLEKKESDSKRKTTTRTTLDYIDIGLILNLCLYGGRLLEEMV